MLIVVAPGQGSQTPGFLRPWLDLPEFADRMSWLSAVAGMDLIAHGTTSDADTLRDTAVAQPLIVAAGLVSLLALFPQPADAFRLVTASAGHSVGEVTVTAAIGVLSAEQAMVFVRERGRAMAEASAAAATGMSAVVGGDADEVAAVITSHGLVIANHNGPGQVVAAGTSAALAALAAAPPPRSRVVALGVAGAFHTGHMAPAVDVLARHARSISTHDPRSRLVSNADGTVIHDGREALRRLVTQVAQPVRWDRCQETFRDLGVTGLIEIPPAGTLANLAKRALPGVDVVAMRTPDDLPAAMALVKEHGRSTPLALNPTWRLVVSPAKGVVTLPGAMPEGHHLAPATVIATVSGLRERHPVTAVHGGTVIEWLVHDGDPVSPGQPLLRLHPTAQPYRGDR